MWDWWLLPWWAGTLRLTGETHNPTLPSYNLTYHSFSFKYTPTPFAFTRQARIHLMLPLGRWVQLCAEGLYIRICYGSLALLSSAGSGLSLAHLFNEPINLARARSFPSQVELERVQLELSRLRAARFIYSLLVSQQFLITSKLIRVWEASLLM